MALTLITGPANSAKAQLLLDGFREAAPRGPLLVVPTMADIDRYRRELASGGAVLGVRVERFSGLIDEIARRARLRSRPLGVSARLRVISAAIAGTRLDELRESATTPGFPDALLRVIGELEAHRIDPPRFTAAVRATAGRPGEPGPRAEHLEELAALYAAYRRSLDAVGRRDRELYAADALDAIRLAPAHWGCSPIYFYGFDDLTPIELDAVETLARVVDTDVTLALHFEPGRVAFAGRGATFQALAPLATRHIELPALAEHYAPGARRALHHLERNLFEERPSRVSAGSSVRLLEGGGERAELELVAAAIAELLDAGMPAEEIAVVLRAPRAAAQLARVLERAGIPHSRPRPGRFGASAVGRGLLALLRCALLEGSAQDLLAWLRTPGVIDRIELVDRLELALRRRGVVDGEAARLEWEREHWPLDVLGRLQRAAAAGPLPLLERVGQELDGLFAAPRARRAALLDADELDDARALTAGRRALAELLELSRADPRLAPDALALHDALAALELPAEDAEQVGQVTVTDPLALRARRVRAMFVCGLQEGVFPAPAPLDPLLSEEDRAALARGAGLRLNSPGGALASLDAERFLFYAAVSRPQELLVLSWHTSEDEGDPAVASLFIDDVVDCFSEDLRAVRGRRALGALSEAPAHEALPSGGAGPARGGRWPPAPKSIQPLRGEAAVAALRDRELWSASSLERWSDCPVRWFVERFLRAEELEPAPEPLARGRWTHAVLEETLRRLAEETGTARLGPQSLGRARELLAGVLAQRLSGPGEENPISTNPERLRAALRRLEADLLRYLDYLAGCGTTLEPLHLELEFGFDSEGSLPALELDGPHVRLRGRIDRVDVEPGGERAVVYDYKGKNVIEGRRWEAERRFQLPLYMAAVRDLAGLEPVGGLYQPLGGRDLRPRGVIVDDADPGLRCVAGDRRSPDEMGELIAAGVERARKAVREARAGALESRPESCSAQGVCAYPTLCRCEDR